MTLENIYLLIIFIFIISFIVITLLWDKKIKESYKKGYENGLNSYYDYDFDG